MNLTRTYWMFNEFLLTAAAGVLLMFPAAAAESASELTCKVTRQPDGWFRYHLSKPPGSASCQTEWEDENKTSIVFNEQHFDQERVQNVSSQSISLRTCLNYLHYKSDCLEGIIEQTVCRVNCSSLLDKFSGSLTMNPTMNSTENSTLICFSESLCLKPNMFGLIVACIVLPVLLPIVVLWFYRNRKRFKCGRERSAAEITTYTAAKEEVKTEMYWMGTDEDEY